MAVYIPGKWIHKAYGAVMLAVVAWSFLPAVIATERLKTYCGELAIGTSDAELRASAEERGYAVSALGDGRAFIDDARSFGRPSCNLRFDGQKLVAAEYSSND